MAAYDSLKSLVQQAIRTNGNNEITGQVLQNVLMAMIDELGGENGYAGVATPSTNPGAPDGKVFYFATEAGTYTHFDGATLSRGIHLLVFNGVTWSHQTLYTIDSEVTSGSNNLITSGAVYTKIINAINALNATVSKSAGADGLSLSLTETGGKVTSISGSIAPHTYDAYGEASAAQSAASTDATNKVNAAKTQILGDAASDYNTLGKLEDKIQAEASRAAAAESALNTEKANKATTLAGYGINDAYTKTEVNGLVSTPHQNYVTVPTYASLPETGSADTIYRVSNYNGSTSQVDASVYSEYAWNGSGYIFLRVVSQIGEVFDITVYNSNTKYADLAAALGTNGANVPSSIRRGGMSVKFVQSSDNKYVQWRYMLSSTTNANFVNVANWQGVDDVPTAKSNNLVKSGGVEKKLDTYSKINKEYISEEGEEIVISDNNDNEIVKITPSGLDAKNLKSNHYNVITEVEFDKVSEVSKEGIPFTNLDKEVIFSDDEETESYVKIGSYGIKAKAYYDMNGNLVNFGLPCTVVDASGSGDYTTIQDAIDNTQDNDVILVMPGTYEEAVEAFGKNRHIVGFCKETCILTNGTGDYQTPPLEMNIGSIKNMTIIADNYNPTIEGNPAENPNAHPSYGVHVEYGNSTSYTLTIENCKIVSKWSAAIGIGLRYNQTLNIVNCELMSESVRVHSSWSNKWVYMGGLYFHNDASQSTNMGTGKISVRNTIMKGYACAITAQSVVGYPSLAEAEFIGCTASSTQHGVGDGNVYRWDYETSPGMWSGEYISLAITSHGNNLSEMNYNN